MTDFLNAKSAYLAQLKEQRVQLDALIAMVEGFGGATPSGPDSGPNIGRHDFVGMSTPEAIKKYLRKKKGLHGPRGIAAGLVEGGQGDDVEAVYVNVYSALKRMRAANPPEVVKHKSEWGLAEEFPNLAKKGAVKGAQDADDDEREDGKEEVSSTNKTTAA